MEVRFISPEVAAGSQTCDACPIWLGTMSTSTENSPPLLDRLDDGVDQRRTVTKRDRVHGLLHQISALLVGSLELVGIERRLVVVAAPDVVHPSPALDQQLVDIGRRPPHMGVGGAGVSFLVPAEAHAATSRPTDVAGGESDIHERAVGAVVVVAPDQALLIGEHGAAARIAVLGRRYPLRRLADLVDREARQSGSLLQGRLVGRDHLVEAVGRSGDHCPVDPTLLGDVRHPGIEQRKIAARVDGQVHHPVLAGLDLAGIDRHGAPRIDDDDPRRGMSLIRKLGALLVHRRATQVRHPMVQEIVGLGLQGIGAYDDDRVGKLRVLVAVVELADAHVARGVDLGVVGRTVVDPDVLHLHGAEVELAGAPGVLIAAAGTAVIESGDEKPVLALIADDLAGDAGDEVERIVPGGRRHRAVAPDHRMGEALLLRRACFRV